MSTNSQLVAGRVAIVTGGGSGIGRAVCIAFAQEGAKVIIADINKKAADETLKQMPDPEKHIAKYLDVSNSDSVNQFFCEIKDFATPDTLVNCAGIVGRGDLTEVTEEMFDEVVAVNLKGTCLMIQAVSKVMIEEKVATGAIINISSIAAKIGGVSRGVIYPASKAGVNALTKSAARQLGPHGIRCNAIMPGFIRTPMTAKTFSADARDFIIKETPLGRPGEPEEIADVCVFLASSKSSFITASIMEVTGGFRA